MWLMQALGFLLSALPVEDILRNLHSLITPYIQQLEKLTNETVRASFQHTHIHKYIQRRHRWTRANGNRPCVCVASLQWNISLRDQIGFDPALWATDSYWSGKCTLWLLQRYTRTHMHSDSSRIEAKLGRHKSALRALKAGHLFTCACTQPRKRILCSA